VLAEVREQEEQPASTYQREVLLGLVVHLKEVHQELVIHLKEVLRV